MMGLATKSDLRLPKNNLNFMFEQKGDVDEEQMWAVFSHTGSVLALGVFSLAKCRATPYFFPEEQAEGGRGARTAHASSSHRSVRRTGCAGGHA
jgi:hypothetical protein